MGLRQGHVSRAGRIWMRPVDNLRPVQRNGVYGGKR